jgi:hypothetical protein
MVNLLSLSLNHKLITPINSISTFIQLIKQNLQDENNSLWREDSLKYINASEELL